MKPLTLFFFLYLCSLVFSHKQYDGFESTLISPPPPENFDGFPRFLQSNENIQNQNEAENANSDEMINDLETQAERIVKLRNEAEKNNAKYRKTLENLNTFMLKAKSFCGEALKECEVGTERQEKYAKHTEFEYYNFEKSGSELFSNKINSSMQQNQDDFNDLIDDFDKIDRLTSKSRVKVEHDPTRKSIMDDLLKETFESSENPSNFKGTNDFTDKCSSHQENLNKKPIKKEEEEEDEDVLENVIKSFEKKEENIAKGLEISDDPEDLIQQFEETEKKEKLMKERFDHIYHKSKNAPQNPLIILRKDKKYSSHEMVEEQLTYFQKIKLEKYQKIPPENLLRAKTNSDFDPGLIYTPEEAQTMLKFSKNSFITIMAAFTSEWLLGYLSTEGENESDVKIFPLMMVSPMFSALVPIKRTYEIKFWSVFGVFEKKEEKEGVKNSLVDHIFTDSPVRPKAIHQAIKDFNFINPDAFLFDKIPLLNLRKGDLVAVTKMPNTANWAEGFVINKENLKLGIFHVGFTTMIKFKIDAEK